MRAAPSRSPRKATASSAVQIGIVNSMATTCASGIIVRARNQPNWARVVDGVAGDVLAEPAVRIAARPPLACSSGQSSRKPSSERISMIWKTCRLRVASRPATAITIIAVSQPVIQAAAFLFDGSNDMRDEPILARRARGRRITPPKRGAASAGAVSGWRRCPAGRRKPGGAAGTARRPGPGALWIAACRSTRFFSLDHDQAAPRPVEVQDHQHQRGDQPDHRVADRTAGVGRSHAGAEADDHDRR